MNGNTERAQCALSRVCTPKKRKRKAAKRIKQIYNISKKAIKKFMPSGPKVVIDLPFEGSWKYRRRERVPKARSRREETITEPIIVLNYLCRDRRRWKERFRLLLVLSLDFHHACLFHYPNCLLHLKIQP